MFDWSFEFPKDGEIQIDDPMLGEEVKSSFSGRLQVMNFVLGSPSVTKFNEITIVRIPVHDSTTGNSIGQAIQIDDGLETSQAVQIYNSGE